MRDREYDDAADAAYDAWRSGRNYDAAWDRAMEAAAYGEDPRGAAFYPRPQPPEPTWPEELVMEESDGHP